MNNRVTWFWITTLTNSITFSKSLLITLSTPTRRFTSKTIYSKRHHHPYLCGVTSPFPKQSSLLFCSVTDPSQNNHNYTNQNTKNKSDPEDYHVGLSDWKTTMNTEPTSTTSTSSTTTESPMETNPPSITKLPIWKETIDISIAKSRKIRGGNFVQIATVDPQTLEPRCRTVVFRGFLPDPPTNDTTTSTDNPTNTPTDNPINSNNNFIMKMITDKRSSKVSEIMSHATPPRAELVWWFSKSSEQYRILGDLHFVGGSGSGSGSIGTGAGGDSTKNNGFTLPFDDNEYYSQARKQQWGNLSDAAREQFYWNDPNTHYEIQAKVPVGGRDENGKVLPPPDTFLLMLLFPKRVDYLRLTDNYRQLDELRKDYEWIPHRINP